MGIIKLTKDALQRQMFQGMSMHVVPRGITVPLDIFALGEVRYGRKLTAVLPLLVPDNRFRLAEDAIYLIDRITLNRPVTWIEAGGYISIGQRELHEVVDVIEDVIVLNTGLLADHAVREPVYHYSNPIKVEGAYSAGKKRINVDSTSYIVRGDYIAISSTPTLTTAFKEYRVVDYHFTSLVNGIYQYQVVLDRGIHRDLDDEEIIQIRAYLAYKSKILPLPVNTGFMQQVRGPFLLDWRSAPFIAGVTIQETQYIQKYDSSFSKIGAPLEIQKNTVFLEAPIKADQFLFWDKVDGEINYDKSEGKFLALLNDQGKWWLKHTCAPIIEIPFTYASGSMVTVAPAGLVNNDWFRINDGEDTMLFEFKVDGTYVPTPTAAATGWITVHPNVAAILNNDGFTLDDGFGTVINFEYKVDYTFVQTNGYRVIDITTAVFAVDVAVSTEAAINAVAALKIIASRIGTQINLTNDEISTKGNQLIVISANLLVVGWTGSPVPGFPPYELTGGTDDLETIDISASTTAVEVAILTSAAINRAELKVTAEAPGIFNSFQIFSEVKGVAGNNPITYSITDPNFLINGMSGGTGGVQWSFEITPDQDILMRIRFYPNAWTDINLVGGSTTLVNASLASTDEPIERIDILMKGATAGEVKMGDWNIATPRMSAVAHEYVSQMLGDHTYAAHGLFIKPLFPSLHDLETKLGLYGKLNSGYLRV